MNGVEVVASWLTPTVLFCVMNLMIVTIFALKPHNNSPKSSENDAVSPPQLARAPSLFERVKSIKLSFSRSENRDPVPVSNVHEDVPNHDQDQARQSPEGSDIHVTRSKSDTGAKSSSPAPAVLMKKSASEKMAASDKEEEEEEGRKRSERGGGDETTVDARADDFINMFRKQLKLQRLKSLLKRAGVLENEKTITAAATVS